MDRLNRDILRLAVPALGALIAEPLYILADTAVVGRLGTPKLGGLALAATLVVSTYTLFIFLAYGTTALVARYIGAGDAGRAAHEGVQGIWLGLVVGGFRLSRDSLSPRGWSRPWERQAKFECTR